MEEIKDTDISRLKCFMAKVSHQKIFTDIRGIFSYVLFLCGHPPLYEPLWLDWLVR